MGFKIVVIDTTARRANIDTTLGSSLSEVLQEACTKLGRDASSHGLKHNNKSLDLSNPVRLSGISPNVKLELVKLSKSPSVVSVALQVLESESQGTTNSRMTDKFPSSTSLWQILRNFESGAAGGLGAQKNFTARGVPQISNGEAGAGRLYYETPVIKYMGRELSSFVDLQKSLGQLGLNGGSALFRLSFQATEDPLEEAMTNIEAYFKSVEEYDNGSRGAHAGSVPTTESVLDAPQSALTQDAIESRAPPEPLSQPPIASKSEGGPSYDDDAVAGSSMTALSGERSTPEDPTPSTPSVSAESDSTGPNQRRISVYKAPSSHTPLAAQQTFNEKDYEPTIAHAKSQQSRLQSSAQNQRLPSYAEDEMQKKANEQKLEATKELRTRIRFPDQTRVDSNFTNSDTADDLYSFVRSLLNHEGAPFLLNYRSPKGPIEVPRNSMQRLIADLEMVGSQLLNVVWEDGASVEARKAPVLKLEHAKNAKDIPVQIIQGHDEEISKPSLSKPESKTTSGGGGRKGGTPIWMKKITGKK